MFCCGACWNAKWAQSNDGPYSCGAPFHCHYQRADAEEGLWCSIELKTELSICAQSVDVISVSGVFSPVQTLAHDTAAATKQSARDQPETNAGNLGPDWFDNTSEMSIELFSDWSLCTMHCTRLSHANLKSSTANGPRQIWVIFGHNKIRFIHVFWMLSCKKKASAGILIW